MIDWSKVRNQQFGEDKESVATVDGVEVGYVSRYRYSRNAMWDAFIGGDRQEKFHDVGSTVKEARKAFEEIYNNV